MNTYLSAAITNRLIERIGDHVNLCELQGDQWITVRRNITRRTAERAGFNLDSPAVERVFAGLE